MMDSHCYSKVVLELIGGGYTHTLRNNSFQKIYVHERTEVTKRQMEK